MNRTDKRVSEEDKALTMSADEMSSNKFVSSQDGDPQRDPEVDTRSDAPSFDVPSFSFEELAKGSAVIRITFADGEYWLRRTRAGKLVLNK